MIKAIFLDLDGTLLNTNNKISFRNIDIIKYIKKNYKIHFFLATGRPFQDLINYYKILNLDTPIICMNGSYIVNFNKKIIKEKTIPLNIVKNLKKECKEYYKKCKEYYNNSLISTILYIGTRIIKYETENINNYLEEKNYNPHKIGIICDNKKILENICKYLKDKFKNILNIHISQSNFIEVVNYNVSKAIAIDFLMKKYFFLKKENILAIGDSDNDISMIKYVGLGIAMGNARKNLKKYSKYITLNNDEDGVAYALEKYIINNK